MSSTGATRGKHYAETRYGFDWGAAVVTRTASHGAFVFLAVETTSGQRLDIRVSDSGRIKLFPVTKSKRAKKVVA